MTFSEGNLHLVSGLQV